MRNLPLGQEIRRAEKTKVGELGERHAASDGRVVGNAGDELICGVQAERILLRIGEVAHKAEVKIVEQVLRKDVGPAKSQAVSWNR